MLSPYREKTVWNGTYLGIDWEIQRFPSFDKNRREHDWTMYLFLVLNRIPKENNPDSFWLEPIKDDKGRAHYNYMGHPVLAEIKWNHGITWYSKECGFDSTLQMIRVGCDYQHFWNFENCCEYDIRWVLDDMTEAVESFRKIVPGYKYWCFWTGKLHNQTEIQIQNDGSYKCECQLKGGQDNVTSTDK